MNTLRTYIRTICLGVMLLPLLAFAQDSALSPGLANFLSDISSLLLLSIGIFGGFSIGFFVWGLILYLSRTGLEHRIDGIIIMEWAVLLIILVIILGGLLRLLEEYPEVLVTLVTLIIIIAVLVALFYVFSARGGEKKEE